MARPSLHQLGAVFLRYGNWTLGGGSATVAVLQTELIDQRKWVNQETFTCVKLCRKNGGDLEQIKFLLGHSSIKTTERYLGSDQEIAIAVNDNLGL
jgi:hypothetical protein